MVLTEPIGPTVIELLRLGFTDPDSVNSREVLSHDISLFLSVVAEVTGDINSTFLEDSITDNLLIHVF